jgi:hypothetical protein
MKKQRTKNKFLDHLRKMPIVASACDALDLSRQTVYRWRHEDSEFAASWDAALSEGEDHINDFVENKLMLKIREEDTSSIRYYLGKRHPKYVDTKPDHVLLNFIKKSRNNEEQTLMDKAHQNVKSRKIEYAKNGEDVSLNEDTVHALLKSLVITTTDYALLMDITKEEADAALTEMWKEDEKKINPTPEEVVEEYLKLKEEGEKKD